MTLPSDTERAIYVKNQKAFRARAGDKVYIFRKAESFENGWYAYWTHKMDQAVGTHGKILSAYNENDSSGIPIKIDNISGAFWYPYTVLKIVR